MFVCIRSKDKSDDMWVAPEILCAPDGYYLIELDEYNARILEDVEGDGPGVMVHLPETGDVYSYRGAAHYEKGKTYLRWDAHCIRDWAW